VDVYTSMLIFRRVAESESFSAVAREIDMSQSAVSKHVASLEQRLGTKLLNRNTRQLNLTEEGTEYYGYCCRILDEIAEVEARVGQGQSSLTGTLRMSSTEPFGRIFIVPFLSGFLKKNPNLKIDLMFENRYVDLIKEGVDLAIRVGPMSDSSLVARKIGVSPRVLVASPEYLASRGEPENLASLQSHDCIIYNQQNSPSEWWFSGPDGKEKVNVTGRLRVTSPEAIGDATLAGLGVSIMMYYSVHNYVKQGKLKIILRHYEPQAYQVNAVYPERKFVPQKVKVMIEHLQESFKAYNTISE